jgi:transposase-like protein
MKDRKIPKKEKVKGLVKKIVYWYKKVGSQEELAELTLRELRRENKKYTLSPTRAKRIALEIPEIEVKAKTKKSISLRKIEKCPICESEIREIKVKNLLGKFIRIGYKCTKCGYESDLEAFMPMKYSFVWKEAKI